MAGNIQNEIINAEIRSTGGKQTQDDIIKVNQSLKDLATEEKNLLFIRNKLESQGKKNTAEYLKNKEAIEANRIKTAQLKEELTKLNGQLKITDMTYNQLTKRAGELRGRLNNVSQGLQPEKWNALNRELNDVTTQMTRVRAGSQQTGSVIGGLTKAAGFLGIGLGSVWGALRFGKSVLESTDATGDKLTETIMGMSTAWDYFRKSLATGDFSDFFSNMRKAIQIGEEYARQLDDIGNRTRALEIAEAKSNVEKQKNLKILRDQTKTDKERIEAGKAIIEEENKLAEVRSSISKQALDARVASFAQLGITKEIVEENLVNYESNKKILDQASEYNEMLEERKVLSTPTVNSYGVSSTDPFSEKRIKEIDLVIAKTDQSVKKFADLQSKYGKLTEEEADELVRLFVAAYNAQASADENTQRISSRLSSLLAENMKKAEKDAEDAVKVEKKRDDEILKARKDLHDKLADFISQGTAATLDAQDKENYQIQEKYREQIFSWMKAAKDKVVTWEEANAAIAKLEDAMGSEIMASTISWQKKTLDEQEKNEEQSKANELKAVEDFETKRKDFLKEFRGKSAEEMKQFELQKLEENYQSLISYEGISNETRLEITEAYEQAKAEIEVKYQDERLDRIKQGVAATQALFETGLNSIQNLQDAEQARLESYYNKQIELAGNNNARVTKLEEQKELSIKNVKKRYADKTFALQVAQITATTAQAAIEAYKAMAGIPYVGPILGAIAAAAAVAYGGSQIKTAKAERDAVKNLYTGGYSGPGDKYAPRGVVHADEYIVASDELNTPVVRSFIGGVVEPMRMRRLGYSPYAHSTTLPGYANGGYSGPSVDLSAIAVTLDRNTKASDRTNVLLDYLITNGVNANFDQRKIHEMRQEIGKQEAGEALARR